MLTRMARLLTRMARMLTRMTRWLAYYTHSNMSDDASILLTGMISSAPLDISVASLSLLASPCSLVRQTFSPSLNG